MKHLVFHFDVLSPYAFLAFERLPQALEGFSIEVEYRPVLLAGILGHWGQKGPVEIEPKRAWTWRQVAWWAHRYGIALTIPPQHPFNPLALLRLLTATAASGATPNRYACERVLRHVWQGGAHDANDPGRLNALAEQLAPVRDPKDDDVKQTLRQRTDDAIARGVFGVPTIEVDGRMFFGVDAMDMMVAFLRRDPWFDGAGWYEGGHPRAGLQRHQKKDG